MNVFLKQLIILIIGNLLISTVSSYDDSIEQSCTTDEDCKSYENKFILSECSIDTCVCSTRNDGKWQECVPQISRVPNEDVMSPMDKRMCDAPNSEYRFGMCRTKIVTLGRACEESVQCKRFDQNSECFEEICMCKEGYMDVDNHCRAIVPTDMLCKTDDQCPKNSQCIRERCVCENDFISSVESIKCLPYRNYNETCEETSQCVMKLGKSSYCKKGVCQCKKNFATIEKDGYFDCVKNKMIGDVCIEDDDCYSEFLHLYCNDYMCGCQSSKEPLPKNTKPVCRRKNRDIDTHTHHHASPQTSGAASIKVFKMFSVFVLFAIFMAL